jgi:hypothetical protein
VKNSESLKSFLFNLPLNQKSPVPKKPQMISNVLCDLFFFQREVDQSIDPSFLFCFAFLSSSFSIPSHTDERHETLQVVMVATAQPISICQGKHFCFLP